MRNANEIIKALNELDLSKTSYVDLVSLIIKIGEIAINQITVPKGSYLVRSRCEKDFILIRNFQEISARTDIARIVPGRCNWYGQPIFYGVIPFYETGRKLAEALSILECSKIMNGAAATNEEYATVGVWYVKDDIQTAAIVTHKDFAKVNQAVNHFYNQFQANVNHLDDPEYFLSLAEYVSSLFAQRPTESGSIQYMLTSAFAHIHFSAGLDGIIYPSVASNAEGDGLNIAIKASELHKLEFNRAVMYRHLRSTINSKSVFQPYLNMKSLGSDGSITWEPAETVCF